MDAESCYPFYVPPPFAPFTKPTSPDRNEAFEDKFHAVSDLELHFNTLFMLESEKGRRNKDLYPIIEESNENLCYWQENAAQHPQKTSNERSESFTYSELSTCSYPNSDYHQSASSTDCSPVKNQQNWTEAIASNYWNYEADVQNNGDSIYTGRLTPDSISEDIIETPYVEKCPLPPLETAFSKHFNRFAEIDASIPVNGVTCNNLDLYPNPKPKTLTVNNLDNYYYSDNLNNEYHCKEERNDKNVEFAELFNCINLDEKNDMLDLGVKVFENDNVERNDCDLITDLDSLNYFHDDEEDDMVGFEEYWSPNADSNANGRFFDDASKEPDSSDGCYCLWRECNVDFKNQAMLVEHIEKTHVNSFKGEEFSCFWESCPRKLRPFNARYKLVIHMRVHTGHKPNICSYPGCGKAFSRLENLKIHSRSHTGERPYRCQAPRCTKAFSNSSDRAKHQRTHFNARPYACQVNGCAKRYTDPSSLRKHVKVHSSVAENIFNAIQINEPEKPVQVRCQKSNQASIKKAIKENKSLKKPTSIAPVDEEWNSRKRTSSENYMSDAKRRIKEKITGNIANGGIKSATPQNDSAANRQMSDWAFNYLNINNETVANDFDSVSFDYQQKELNVNFYDV